MFKFNFNNTEFEEKDNNDPSTSNVIQPQEIDINNIIHKIDKESKEQTFHISSINNIKYLTQPLFEAETLKELSHTDLQTNIYEGGYKIWECTYDMLNYIKDINFENKTVLDLGCGAGLLGIYAMYKNAKIICFQDYNKEVIESLVIPNVIINRNDIKTALDDTVKLIEKVDDENNSKEQKDGSIKKKIKLDLEKNDINNINEKETKQENEELENNESNKINVQTDENEEKDKLKLESGDKINIKVSKDEINNSDEINVFKKPREIEIFHKTNKNKNEEEIRQTNTENGDKIDEQLTKQSSDISHLTNKLNTHNIINDKIINKCKFYYGDWNNLFNLINNKFDIILTSETIYNVENYMKLINLFQNLLKDNGEIYLASKIYYFGVGGCIYDFQNKLKENNFKFINCWEVKEGVKRIIIKICKK